MQRYRDRKQRKRSIVESDNVDRWLVSYADFITLLFAFFVVMYAISSVNNGKYRVLSDTLIEAFKSPTKSRQSTQISKPAQKSQSHLLQLANRIERNLQPQIDKHYIKVSSSKLWTKVEIKPRMLFSKGSAELQTGAYEPLKKLGRILAGLPNYIDVEGYTDDLPINTAMYPSNWELSAARAASVVHLFIKNGVVPEHLSVIGYGQYRPVADNATVEGRRRNRRVTVVILADKYVRRMQEIENNSVKAPK